MNKEFVVCLDWNGTISRMSPCGVSQIDVYIKDGSPAEEEEEEEEEAELLLDFTLPHIFPKSTLCVSPLFIPSCWLLLVLLLS